MSLGILEAKRGRDSCVEMFKPLSELSFCLTEAGRPEEMERIAKRCLAIQETDLGQESTPVAETLYLIGGCLSHPHQVEEGENVARRCVKIQEVNLGRKSDRLIPALNLLGSFLSRAGKLEEAEDILSRSVAILDEVNQLANDASAQHEHKLLYRNLQHLIGTTVHALGSCLLQAGKLEEAERTLRRGLVIHETELRPENAAVVSTGDVLNNTLRQTYPYALHALGTCLMQAEKFEEVEDMLRRGLAIHEKNGNYDGVDVANTLFDLASYLRQTGESKKAEELLRRCLSIREAKLGLEDILVGVVLVQLGMCLGEALRSAEAVDVLRRSLCIHDVHLGLEHIVTPSVLYPLAASLIQTGEMDEAEDMMRRCLANQEGNMGKDHQAVAYTLHVFGVFLRQRGKLKEAQELLRRCIAIYQAKTGTEHICMMTSARLELSICLRHEGDLKDWGQSEISVGSSSSTLRILDDDDWEYEALCDLFKTRWLKPQPTNGVSIVRIFSIQVPLEVHDKHELYKRMVVVNLRQRFHGTSCNDGCNFMVDPQGATAPCGLSSCSVCNICMLGFKLGKNVARTARASGIPLRYGTGIYFSSVSGKANDYARLSAKTGSDGAELRCMFVANVAGGKAFSTKKSHLPQSECPPSGCQSVVGEVGHALNYDEVVVYKEEAALPTHLIVYAPRH
ncbi:TPR repeat-containing protein [Ectocarpus siliculosus]|uniref:TPR repeat-containing protein n=1 Tax=Ectocarpus siliculosus TaxID=2880 RepID=D8LKU5_ECTSI|nr:TPR repeat-containing protein [Ectocarpus siliculosus]|eukprot:CBN80078.1 TPR repeat-containing protein [Ectocarpus siliculosus]